MDHFRAFNPSVNYVQRRNFAQKLPKMFKSDVVRGPNPNTFEPKFMYTRT